MCVDWWLLVLFSDWRGLVVKTPLGPINTLSGGGVWVVWGGHGLADGLIE